MFPMRYPLLAAVFFSACSASPHAGRVTESYSDVESYEDHVLRMHHVDVDGGQLAYIDEGEGDVVVLMHGIPTSSWMYRKLISPLVAKGYRVIAPDLMGMGASEKVETPVVLNVKGQAGHMLELLGDHLDLRDWIHVVHDFGGPISWEMMEDPRFRASRMVLLDTFAFERGWHPDLNMMIKTGVQLATGETFDSVFFSVAVKGMVHDSKFASKPMLHGYCRPLEEGAAHTFRCLYFESNDLKAELPRYQASLKAYDGEVLGIVWGKHDEFLSYDEQVKQLKSLWSLPDSKVVVLEDVGHLVAEEDPGAIVKMVTGSR